MKTLFYFVLIGWWHHRGGVWRWDVFQKLCEAVAALTSEVQVSVQRFIQVKRLLPTSACQRSSVAHPEVWEDITVNTAKRKIGRLTSCQVNLSENLCLNVGLHEFKTWNNFKQKHKLRTGLYANPYTVFSLGFFYGWPVSFQTEGNSWSSSQHCCSSTKLKRSKSEGVCRGQVNVVDRVVGWEL